MLMPGPGFIREPPQPTAVRRELFAASQSANLSPDSVTLAGRQVV